MCPFAQLEHLERIAQVEHMENHRNDTRTWLLLGHCDLCRQSLSIADVQNTPILAPLLTQKAQCSHEAESKYTRSIRCDITDQERTCSRQERGQGFSIALLYQPPSCSIQQLVYIISFQSPIQS
jgi:hypothetical protein